MYTPNDRSRQYQEWFEPFLMLVQSSRMIKLHRQFGNSTYILLRHKKKTKIQIFI